MNMSNFDETINIDFSYLPNIRCKIIKRIIFKIFKLLDKSPCKIFGLINLNENIIVSFLLVLMHLSYFSIDFLHCSQVISE